MSTREQATAPADRYVIPVEVDVQAPVTFDEPIAQQHWRFDPADHDEIYLIGDVHGSIDNLERLWARLSPSDDDLVVFVGDLVRKGPASVEVANFVAESPHAVSVRGNNETKLLRGTVDTAPFEPIIETVAELPLVISFGDSVVVHGGLHPEWTAAAHESDDILEMRSVPQGNGYDGPFWFEIHDGPPRVFFGHTVLKAPYVSDGAVGLDTGCVYGGELTAYDWREDEFLSVPGTEHQSRPDRKFVDIKH
jgi:Calcineurin-like phosphoesterase.